ncbi:hypothetical protein Pla22_11530 [Rubripirellula amarantea]|uniref:Uncharacterized protein n=1 Tax=Rubripirellula amarantea TaxID=2527999 RepID=A0A5C5WRJ5_9BACT|nr:glycosyltransferase family 39 protein [Rubripirellula amarantea]TWT53524.1 hypothetical protein Pla22_11530 [Rubripirellula amarantea]
MTASTNDPTSKTKRQWLWVLLPITLYVALRLPILVHAPGGQDEQWFAVPGWTVWNEGIPRIPYLPTKDRSTFFENADVCMFTLPPALFYVQAPFHAIFPPGYPTSRIPLFLGAIAAIVLTFHLARRLGSSLSMSLLVATLLALSRPLMFTGLMVRPDLLSAFCGWISLTLLWNYLTPASEDRQRRLLVGSGIACGLGGLFHPLALVFAMQAGVAMLCARGQVRSKALNLLCFGVACGATFCLWLPLIIKFPYEFRSQFFPNVLDRAGPGLTSRMVWPWVSLRHHANILFELLGPWQCAFFLVAIVLASIGLWRTRPRREAIGYLALVWSSVYLTAVVAGLHPIKGYWVYSSLWILAGLAPAIDYLIASYSSKFKTIVALSVWILSIGLMLPGAGLRSTWLYATNWGDPQYHGTHFIEEVLDELPKEGLFLADLSYVYPLYLSGRETLLCQERQQYWGDRELDYTGILLAWEGEDAGWANQYDASFVKRFGSRDVPQECFVDWFVQKNKNNE